LISSYLGPRAAAMPLKADDAPTRGELTRATRRLTDSSSHGAAPKRTPFRSTGKGELIAIAALARATTVARLMAAVATWRVARARTPFWGRRGAALAARPKTAESKQHHRPSGGPGDLQGSPIRRCCYVTPTCDPGHSKDHEALLPTGAGRRVVAIQDVLRDD
jgi:hypothetical protein